MVCANVNAYSKLNCSIISPAITCINDGRLPQVAEDTIIEHSVRFNLGIAASDRERQILQDFNDDEQQHLASELLKILDQLLAPSQNGIKEWRTHLEILTHGECLCIDIDPPICKLTISFS
jgi:hypothetical protein